MWYALFFVAPSSTIHGGARSVIAGVCSKIFDGKQQWAMDRRRRRRFGLCLAALCTFNTYRSGYDSNVYGMYFVAGIVGVEREKWAVVVEQGPIFLPLSVKARGNTMSSSDPTSLAVLPVPLFVLQMCSAST